MIDTRVATWPEVKEYVDRGAVAILAFGAQEEHGPHLPLSTDTIEAGGLARRLAEELDAMLLPPIAYGDSWGATGFPGTVSITFSTIYALVTDIGKSLKFNHVRGLIVVNGHFGNHNPIELAARELTTQHDFPTMMLDFPGLVEIAGQVLESKPAAPTFYHADEFETSMVLALEPATVHMDRAQAEYPEFPVSYYSEPILLDTFCKSGVFGDPRPATAEKGKRMLEMFTRENLKIARAFIDRIDARENGLKP